MCFIAEPWMPWGECTTTLVYLLQHHWYLKQRQENPTGGSQTCRVEYKVSRNQRGSQKDLPVLEKQDDDGWPVCVAQLRGQKEESLPVGRYQHDLCKNHPCHSSDEFAAAQPTLGCHLCISPFTILKIASVKAETVPHPCVYSSQGWSYMFCLKKDKNSRSVRYYFMHIWGYKFK